jgi:hypothetical protein
MKRLLNASLLFVLVCCFALSAAAQRTHAVSAGVGTIYYYGDLTDRFNNSLLRPSLSLAYTRYITGNFGFRVAVAGGEIGATDAMAMDELRIRRNLHFRSRLYEASAVMIYEIIQDKNFGNSWVGVPHFSPYVFAGVGMFYFNPQARYQNVWYDLQPLGTEGQQIPGAQPGPYSLVQVSLPFGAGVTLRMSEYAGMNFEIGYRTTLTDYLDDVSTSYPDFAKLNEVSGPIAVALSSRSTTWENNPGEIRGNPEANDSFFIMNVAFTYYLSRFSTRN